MSDEPKEKRINIEDLPQAEEELTPEEAREVKGGIDNREQPARSNVLNEMHNL